MYFLIVFKSTNFVSLDAVKIKVHEYVNCVAKFNLKGQTLWKSAPKYGESAPGTGKLHKTLHKRLKRAQNLDISVHVSKNRIHVK